MSSLESLHKEIKSCKACPLRETCTQVVPGEGADNAQVFIMGEGPGEQEDGSGVPFIGRSGQFLRLQMTRNRLFEYGVYITNSVRCRPPGNRDPHPQEAEACWPWTHKTLKLIQPKVIVTLGKPALATLASKFSLKIPAGGFAEKVAGKRIYIEDRHFFVFPMTHPAYAQRRKQAQEQFSAHMRYLSCALPTWLRRP